MLRAWDGKKVVRSEGFEPPTLGSEDRCSIQLSYERAGLNCSRPEADGKPVLRFASAFHRAIVNPFART